jgi:hypothetical protein
MFWIVLLVVAVLALGYMLWRDRRHHGRVDQGRVNDGVTKMWTDDITMSRRDRRG